MVPTGRSISRTVPTPDQRRLIGPLQVVDDDHGGGGRAQLVHQGRLADAGLALDPDHRALSAAEGVATSTEDRELLLGPTQSGGRSRGHMSVTYVLPAVQSTWDSARK
jgi:hypothetical protein